MKRKREIDISSEELRNNVYNILDSFTSKNQAHKYFGISDSTSGAKYLEKIASEVGFDLTVYVERRKPNIKICKECGEIITSRHAKDFCSSSCAAKYNNKNRDESVYKKQGESVSKTLQEKYKIHNEIKRLEKEKKKEFKKEKIKREYKPLKHSCICEICGAEFESTNKNARFCSCICQAKNTHINAYKDFLENNEKYCRGNYTPKCFKQDFLEEQNGVCAICGCKPEHNGKVLVFVMDHIDGDASNNKRDNLRMVCPNCDSQLPTFKSKNKNSTRRNYWKENILKKIVI